MDVSATLYCNSSNKKQLETKTCLWSFRKCYGSSSGEHEDHAIAVEIF